jgi:hypothetical protein
VGGSRDPEVQYNATLPPSEGWRALMPHRRGSGSGIGGVAQLALFAVNPCKVFAAACATAARSAATVGARVGSLAAGKVEDLVSGAGGAIARFGFGPGRRGTSVAPNGSRAVDDVLPTPSVSHPKLQNIVSDLYRGTTNPKRVGHGTTMDAIRNELATGRAVHGRRHLEKGHIYSNALRNWLTRNPSAPAHDRRVAQSLYDELQGALGGQ